MSRSVESVGNNVIFFNATDFNDLDYDDLMDNIRCGVMRRFKSFCIEQKKWAEYPYRENRIILENNFVSISISEYCGCGAISVFVRKDLDYRVNPSLAENWLYLSFPGIKKIIREYCTSLRRIAIASNGEAFYGKE
jgi:hypothetical protein